jgi:hypothetical protein
MRVRNTVLIAFVLVLLALPWAGADEIAEVTNNGDRLIFHPVVEFAQMRLTVTGPCAYEYSQVVTEGDLVFPLDETTIDGVYRFYLMRIENINPDVIEALLQARQNNDPEVPKALCREGVLPGPPLNQSSGFLVINGTIVWDPDAIEEQGKVRTKSDGIPAGDLGLNASSMSVAKDQVINDDLIVRASACIGFDCANGETFNYDTIKLKENNLRIKFDDTSIYSNYPRNDWQLTANSSSNGGLSKFSIDDITGGRTPFTVEADAYSHSLYVDDSGRIGNRTSTPVVELHTVDGDTPTLRLQQDGSSGFSPQTWDVAGNETNFFVRDASNGSTLPFRIRPGAPTSSIDIDEDGNVGIGTGSPDAELHVLQGGTAASGVNSSTGLLVQNTSSSTSGSIVSIMAGSSGNSQIFFGDTNLEYAGRFIYSHGSDTMRFFTDGSEKMRIDSDGNVGFNTTSLSYPLTVGDDGTNGNGAHVTAGGTWANGSSRKFKQDITQLEADDAFAALASLEPVRFRYTLEPEEEYVGFIAEEVPELVAMNSRKYISPIDIVAVLTKVVQEQQQSLLEQQAANQEQQAINQELLERIAALEAR